MHVFEFKSVVFDYRYPEKVVETATVCVQDSNLPEVLEAFGRFLRAAGFSFDGELEIIPEEEEQGICDDEDDEVCFECEKPSEEG